MNSLQHRLSSFLLIIGLGISVYGSEGNRKDSQSCKNVESLRGLFVMLESVSESLEDIVSSARHKTDTLEDDLCIHPKTSNCSSISSACEDDKDHCVRAEPDCKSLHNLGFRKSGTYRIWPPFLNHSMIVYCDMDTDGGGWTVIQRRGDFGEPQISFYETWSKYKKGFGDLKEEFWLGNDVIFAMTNQAQTVLRVDLEDFTGDKRYAKYQNFLVRGEQDDYNMTLGQYNGNAGNSMAIHSGVKFMTKDHGNHCPREFKGGWWYRDCHEANLNGLYHQGNHSSFADGINWLHFRGHQHSMRVSEMKIRRCDC